MRIVEASRPKRAMSWGNPLPTEIPLSGSTISNDCRTVWINKECSIKIYNLILDAQAGAHFDFPFENCVPVKHSPPFKYPIA